MSPERGRSRRYVWHQRSLPRELSLQPADHVCSAATSPCRAHECLIEQQCRCAADLDRMSKRPVATTSAHGETALLMAPRPSAVQCAVRFIALRTLADVCNRQQLCVHAKPARLCACSLCPPPLEHNEVFGMMGGLQPDTESSKRCVLQRTREPTWTLTGRCTSPYCCCVLWTCLPRALHLKRRAGHCALTSASVQGQRMLAAVPHMPLGPATASQHLLSISLAARSAAQLPPPACRSAPPRMRAATGPQLTQSLSSIATSLLC